MWERWDGFIKGKGFQSKTMNSFNHFAYGAVGEYLYRIFLGINYDEEHPGFKRIILAPFFCEDLEWVEGHYDSIYGRIYVFWRRDNAEITLRLSIPPNTSAILHLHSTKISSVHESGNNITEREHITVLGQENNSLHLSFGSGLYSFRILDSK